MASIMTQRLSRSKRKALGIRIKPREGLWINYQLRLRGITHQKLADRLGIRRDTVTKIIRGIRHSSRIEDTLYQTLGYPSFEAMIAAARGHDGDAV
jgi:transcriptional regulator with XRE-family HTH domain